jgi:hypothetical protein
MPAESRPQPGKRTGTQQKGFRMIGLSADAGLIHPTKFFKCCKALGKPLNRMFGETSLPGRRALDNQEIF